MIKRQCLWWALKEFEDIHGVQSPWMLPIRYKPGFPSNEWTRPCGHKGSKIMRTCRACVSFWLYNNRRDKEILGWTTVHPDHRTAHAQEVAWFFEKWVADGAKGGFEECPGFENCSATFGGMAWLAKCREDPETFVDNPDSVFALSYTNLHTPDTLLNTVFLSSLSHMWYLCTRS